VATAQDRALLARMVRELETQLRSNLTIIFKAWVPHQDHVMHYFRGYEDYLRKALAFPEMPQRDMFSERLRNPLFVHRDNTGALMGRIGELASGLEASLQDVAMELDTARKEISSLREQVKNLFEKNAELEKRLGIPRVLGDEPNKP
jgi:hypothetical protein